jgi:hypothetical protein
MMGRKPGKIEVPEATVEIAIPQIRVRNMNLAIFDIDGTLTESVVDSGVQKYLESGMAVLTGKE